MAQTRQKAKGRREDGAFVALPCRVLDSENFKKLTGKGLKLLLDLCSQLRFKRGGAINNGDLTAAMTILCDRGWNSNESLDYAIKELLHYGFISVTRKGYKKVCSLYAVTWLAIDDCNGKLDVKPTRKSSNEYFNDKPKWVRPKRKTNSLHRKTDIYAPDNGVKVVGLVKNAAN